MGRFFYTKKREGFGCLLDRSSSRFAVGKILLSQPIRLIQMAATTTGSTGSRGGARRGNAGSPGGSDSRRGRGERAKSGGRGGGGARESLGEAGEGWTLPPAGLGEGCQLVDIGINLSHRTLARDLEGVLSRSAAAGG